MPRISAEARATAGAARAGHLSPSPHLNAAEKRVWKSVVGAAPAGHLTERDRPLLESFVTLAMAQRKLHDLVADATAEQMVAADAAIKRLESIGKTLAGLSNRLKIAPLGGLADAHKAGIRNEPGQQTPPLLGGLTRVK